MIPHIKVNYKGPFYITLPLVSKSNYLYLVDFYIKNTLPSNFHITDNISKNLIGCFPIYNPFPKNNCNGTHHGSEDINITKGFPYYKEVY